MQLTAQEQDVLLWEPGDWYEAVPGTINFSASREIQVNGAKTMKHSFFFEASGDWGTKEWDIAMMEGNIPNGPALLILLRRGNAANVFGLVSMVNRAWTHTVPLAYCPMIEQSSKFKQMDRSTTVNAVKSIAAGTAIAAIPLFGRSMAKKFMTNQMAPTRAQNEGAAGVCRGFMFRLSQSADQYWNAGGSSTSGKL